MVKKNLVVLAEDVYTGLYLCNAGVNISQFTTDITYMLNAVEVLDVEYTDVFIIIQGLTTFEAKMLMTLIKKLGDLGISVIVFSDVFLNMKGYSYIKYKGDLLSCRCVACKEDAKDVKIVSEGITFFQPYICSTGGSVGLVKLKECKASDVNSKMTRYESAIFDGIRKFDVCKELGVEDTLENLLHS